MDLEDAQTFDHFPHPISYGRVPPATIASVAIAIKHHEHSTPHCSARSIKIQEQLSAQYRSKDDGHELRRGEGFPDSPHGLVEPWPLLVSIAEALRAASMLEKGATDATQNTLEQNQSPLNRGKTPYRPRALASPGRGEKEAGRR